MKITIVLPSLLPGGAEHQTLSQIDELINRGLRVQLIVLSDKKNLLKKVNSNCELLIIDEPAFTSLNKATFIKIFSHKNKISSAILNFNPDVIISNLPTAHFVIRFIKFFNKKITAKVFNYHHSTQYKITPLNTLPKKIVHRINGYLSIVDSGNIYISHAVKKDIENNFPAKNGIVIYNAIPKVEITTDFEKQVLSQFGLENINYYIIPGRLHPVKGHKFFLEATSDFIKEKGLTIVFVGHGPEKESLQQLVKQKKLTNAVLFTDYVENKKMLALIKNASLVIIPSLEEGLGNIAIESLMMGKTILASNAGGLPEVVIDGENGYVFDKGDSKSLLYILKKITNHLSDYKMSETAQKLDYNKRFTLTSQIDEIIAYVNR